MSTFSLTSGMGTAFAVTGGPTVMITIKVKLVPGGGGAAPGPNEGITGAFIDITRR